MDDKKIKILIIAITMLLVGLIFYFSSSLTKTDENSQTQIPPPPDQIITKNKPAIFNKSNILVKDPVCGKMVENGSPFSVQFLKKDFYFCCEECMNKFKQEPDKYVKIKVDVKVKDNTQVTPPDAGDTTVNMQDIDDNSNTVKKEVKNNSGSDESYPDGTVERTDETPSGEKPLPEKTVEDNY